MSWNTILGHDRTKKILQKTILDNKIANSYCFWGTDGIGKDALAIEFAKTVNCSSPVISGESIDSCGNCPSCREFTTLQHPNLTLVFSLPAGKSADSKSDSPVAKLTDEQISLIQEEISAKASDPYHRFSLPNANQIRIASIREVKKNLTLSASGSGRRFVIISRADEMTQEAANAFLKTLEEPHENITIIITTSRRETILPTILSRCQQLRIEPVPDYILAEWLVKTYSVSPSDASIISSFAQGSVTRARDFLNEDMQQERELAVTLLRTSLKKKEYRQELLALVDDLIKSGDKKKIETVLFLLMTWLRDVYSLARTGDPSFIINFDQEETMRKFISRFDGDVIDRVLAEIESSVGLIRKNVNLQLILISLFLKIRQIFIAINI